MSEDIQTIQPELVEQRGGARPGAGRKPKALRYAAELAEAEGRIIAALPNVIDGLVKAAEGGDVAAARYLLDRVWGRVAAQAKPVAEDESLPAEHPAAEGYALLRRTYQTAQALDQEQPKKLLQKLLLLELAGDDPEATQKWQSGLLLNSMYDRIAKEAKTLIEQGYFNDAAMLREVMGELVFRDKVLFEMHENSLLSRRSEFESWLDQQERAKEKAAAKLAKKRASSALLDQPADPTLDGGQ